MAKALNFKVTTEASSTNTTLEQIDHLLDEVITDAPTADYITAYGISDADIAEFQQRKADYQSGKDKPVAWETIKERYGLI